MSSLVHNSWAAKCSCFVESYHESVKRNKGKIEKVKWNRLGGVKIRYITRKQERKK